MLMHCIILANPPNGVLFESRGGRERDVKYGTNGTRRFEIFIHISVLSEMLLSFTSASE